MILMNCIKAVFAVLGVIIGYVLFRDIKKNRNSGESAQEKFQPFKSGIIGFIANFCDAIGIGSYAVTISLNRVWKVIPIRLLPGTLTVGIGVFATIAEIIIGMSIFPVDPILIIMIAVASAVGGYFGAKMMSAFSEKKVATILGFILIVVGIIVAVKSYNAFFGSHDVSMNQVDLPTGLSGGSLVITGIAAFIIGILQAWGLGAFAPMMAVLVLLGLNPKSIFPCMYVTAGAGMCSSSFKFITSGAYSRKNTPVLAVFGVIGVILALTLISSLDTRAINVMICIILLYIGGEMFIKGLRMKYIFQQADIFRE